MDVNSSNVAIEEKEIVIVGAGIAGLAAAATLEQSNFKDYIVLEAQSYIGGRICSTLWNNKWLELGAQFLHGTGSTLAQLAEKNDFLSDVHAAEGEGLYLREDGTEIEHDLILEVDDIVRNILEDCEKYALNTEIDYMEVENIGKVLRSRFFKYLKMKDDPPHIKKVKEEIFDWNVRFLLIDNACDSLDELSLKNWGKFEAVSGPEHNLFKSHYSTVVELIAEKLTQDNLLINHPVKKIEWNKQINSKNSKPIVIELANNTKILSNCVIITSSLGFLKENHVKFFDPNLPTRYTMAIQSLGFGMINKVFLDFNEPWWEPNTKGFQFLWDLQSDICNNNQTKTKLPLWTRDLTGFDVMKNHSGILLGWIGGKGARIMETLSEEQIIRDCAKLFRYFLKNDDIPEASKCLRSCWFNNQYVRGGYSHITKKCDINGISPATLAEPIWRTVNVNGENENLPILMFAGEATHDNYYSTTHGAYDTGVKQAETFLKYYFTK